MSVVVSFNEDSLTTLQFRSSRMTQDFLKDSMQVALPRISISILPIYSLIYFIFHLIFFYDIKIIIQNVQVT